MNNPSSVSSREAGIEYADAQVEKRATASNSNDDADPTIEEYFCTFAVTGCHPSFQDVYVCQHPSCRTDSDSSTLNVGVDNEPGKCQIKTNMIAESNESRMYCLCEGCAMVCHAHDGSTYHIDCDEYEADDKNGNDHNDDDDVVVDYLGVGLSYCDCNKLFKETNRSGDVVRKCQLLEKSTRMISQWGMTSGCLQTKVVDASASTSCAASRIHSSDAFDNSHFLSTNSFVRDAFHMDIRCQELTPDHHSNDTNEEWWTWLRLEAHEIVKHTKETHWLDFAAVRRSTETTETSLSGLEKLAWTIFQQHVQHYQLSEIVEQPLKKETDEGHIDNGCKVLGVEWWVQVKPVAQRGKDNKENDESNLRDEAVDLHYDKDEILAENFHLGVFPSLSTVTYLTDRFDGDYCDQAVTPSPTVVFSRIYEEKDDTSIDEMFISHPRLGNHIVFDGRLLHGAPSHLALRRWNSKGSEGPRQAISQLCDPRWRVTFLVNVWVGHRPANVSVLNSDIRQAVKHASTNTPLGALRRFKIGSGSESVIGKDCLEASVLFFPLETPIAYLGNESASANSLDTSNARIMLPFLGEGTTWDTTEGDHGVSSHGDPVRLSKEDDSHCTIVSTYPPPNFASDTILVRFGTGSKALLQSGVSLSVT